MQLSVPLFRQGHSVFLVMSLFQRQKTVSSLSEVIFPQTKNSQLFFLKSLFQRQKTDSFLFQVSFPETKNNHFFSQVTFFHQFSGQREYFLRVTLNQGHHDHDHQELSWWQNRGQIRDQHPRFSHDINFQVNRSLFWEWPWIRVIMIMTIKKCPDDKTEVRFEISILDLVMMSVFRSSGAVFESDPDSGSSWSWSSRTVLMTKQRPDS